MCPGGDDETLNLVLPTLRKAAAKDPHGNPCVGHAGTGGAGHYVKMIHNGIEHGMMCAISEAWSIMVSGLGMSYEEIGDELAAWNDKGELRGTFLIKIGADICRTTNKGGYHVLQEVEDKVVQDYTGEEGTGIWSNTEAVELHVPAPTLSTAHFLRIASGDRHQRTLAQSAFGGAFTPQKLDVSDRAAFLEDLRSAVYTACLAAYVQGINEIDQSNKMNHFNIDFAAVLQIWRAGCIIQADYIAEMLKPVFEAYESRQDMNLLHEKSVAQDLKKGVSGLKRVSLKAVEADHVLPSLTASLEWIKYQVSTGKCDEKPSSLQMLTMFDRFTDAVLRGRARLLWQAHV